MNEPPLILALPKGRILNKVLPLFDGTEFSLKDSLNGTRKILLDTHSEKLKIIVVRGWDVPTYVLAGAAHIGIVGKDILLEKGTNEYFEIADLNIAHCRLSLAGPISIKSSMPKMRIATKYPVFSKHYLASKGIQAETVYLNGSIEIAPFLGLCDAIIDLVDTGNTLKQNGLEELEVIRSITSRLIVNKAALKTKGRIINELMEILIKK